MLEDETDVYLSTGADFIAPLIAGNIHVMERNETVTRNPPANPSSSMKSIEVSGRPNIMLRTGQSQSQPQTEEDDVPCRSHQVNFSSSTKDSLLDELELALSQKTKQPVNAANDIIEASPRTRLDTTDPVPVPETVKESIHHPTDVNRSSRSSSSATNRESETEESVASQSPTTRFPGIINSPSTSPAKGTRKGMKHDRGSFSGSVDLDRLKIYIKANGEFNALSEEENPGKGLVVERNWTFIEFLTFAGRKIGMSNASRVFSRLGTDGPFYCLLPSTLLIRNITRMVVASSLPFLSSCFLFDSR